MRLLLDECVPARLKRYLNHHQVQTVVQRGWAGTKNGKLLALAAQEFDVLVTVDKNLPYQQNTTNLPITVAVLDSASNEISALIPLLDELERMLITAPYGAFLIIRP